MSRSSNNDDNTNNNDDDDNHTDDNDIYVFVSDHEISSGLIDLQGFSSSRLAPSAWSIIYIYIYTYTLPHAL